MAKQDINLGTQPTGVGGDTNRSASLKTNANLRELYVALGGSAGGGNGSALPNAIPVNKGGTGVTSLAELKDGLGWRDKLVAGENDGNKYGLLGDFTPTSSGTNEFIFEIYGLNTFSNVLLDSAEIRVSTRFFQETSNPIGHVKIIKTSPTPGSGLNFFVVNDKGRLKLYLKSVLYTARFQIVVKSIVTNIANNVTGPVSSYTSQINWENSIPEGAVKIPVAASYSTINTTVDSNGFIKAASPIVELYADRIELNDEAQLQAITFEKLGIGDYLIKGSSGLAQSGWYVEQPKDSNGNVYHAVVYDTLGNGDISVKAYEQKMDGVKIVADLDKPVDIKENRFISIRLQELPQKPIEDTQPDPTITDYQGNPAPSRLHELVDGTWTISGENAAILENERLSAMPALTRRQFRLALVLNGYNLADIETLINSIEDPMQRQLMLIEWQDANTFERTNPSLLLMADLMQLNTVQVDALWSQALTL